MTAHPRSAFRNPLKAARLADRQSRIGGVLDWGISRWNALDVQPCATHVSSHGGGHLTGMLRVQAVEHRRGAVLPRRSLS